jgi:Family of unknown function (DUF6152)
MRTWLVLLAALALLGTVPASGHHSFAAYYFEDQSVAIEGDVVELDYRNPHAWVHVMALDLNGKTQKVSAEWASPGRLNQQGITKDTLKPGDRVIITGSPSRDESAYKLHLKGIERRADGWKWVGRGPQRR